MGAGDKQVVGTQYRFDCGSKGSFITADNFIDPGAGVLNIWFFLAGKRFWKGIQVHCLFSVKHCTGVHKSYGENLKFSGIY